MKIGLALSGGGIRAVVFHLGVLSRLANQALLEKITFLSTVSGGSLAIALVWVCSQSSWPSSVYFLKHIIQNSRYLLTERDLQQNYIFQTLKSPWQLVHGRASVLGGVLQNCWGIKGLLSDLPDVPRWIINATCYETGKNWRFMRKRMGDYLAGYVLSPQLPIAQAVAVSAAYPGLIGSLTLRTNRFVWHKYDNSGQTRQHGARFAALHLWDGGVYDNLGIEALFKPLDGYRDGFDFLVVSDASSLFDTEYRRSSAPKRLLDISTDQVRSLRARTIVSHLQDNPGTGVYLKIGNTEKQIYQQAKQPIPRQGMSKSLDVADVQTAARMNTTLRKISKSEFNLLYRHGYQVADATLSAYCGEQFNRKPLII